VPPRKGGTFCFPGLIVDAIAPMRASLASPNFQVIAMTKSATSHLLPVFARVDLGFERGEGAWLIATNGERYLDFT
jgi:acetylornithine/N-succinyldiaminopimelate aminotransferase